MVSFTVRMRFDSADVDAVRECLRQLTPESRKEPGCVSYIPHFVTEDPSTIVIYEQYVDEAALAHHRGTPHFQKYALDGLFKMMLERHLERLDVVP